MVPDAEKLGILIVAADSFVRSQFQSAAIAAGDFADALLAEDSYDAMALLWDAFEAGCLPDVIVADFDLGNMNAIQFARELRRHGETRRVRLAVLSITESAMDRFSAETAGADFYERYAPDGSDLATIFTTFAQKITQQGVVL